MGFEVQPYGSSVHPETLQHTPYDLEDSALNRGQGGPAKSREEVSWVMMGGGGGSPGGVRGKPPQVQREKSKCKCRRQAGRRENIPGPETGSRDRWAGSGRAVLWGAEGAQGARGVLTPTPLMKENCSMHHLAQVLCRFVAAGVWHRAGGGARNLLHLCHLLWLKTFSSLSLLSI